LVPRICSRIGEVNLTRGNSLVSFALFAIFAEEEPWLFPLV
jgi:hypothetical protein